MIARWMAIGFALWLAITLSLRFVEQDLFTQAAWLLPIVPFAVFVVTYGLLLLQRVEPEDRAEVASIFALPGLLVGIYEINSFAIVFPNLAPALHTQFATLMYASYAATILAGVLSSRMQGKA